MKTRCCSACKQDFPATDEYFYRSKGRLRGQCKSCFLEKQNKTKRETYRHKQANKLRGPIVRGDAYRNRYMILRTPDNSYPRNVPGNEVYFYRGEFHDMLAEGTCLTPGTLVKQNGSKYVVCGDGRRWLEFKKADYPLDAEMPPQRLEQVR